MKGLDVPEDLTVRLAEWIELVDAVGADMIFLYKYEVHLNKYKFSMIYEYKYRHFYTTSFCGIYVGYNYYYVGLSHIF